MRHKRHPFDFGLWIADLGLGGTAPSFVTRLPSFLVLPPSLWHMRRKGVGTTPLQDRPTAPSQPRSLGKARPGGIRVVCRGQRSSVVQPPSLQSSQLSPHSTLAYSKTDTRTVDGARRSPAVVLTRPCFLPAVSHPHSTLEKSQGVDRARRRPSRVAVFRHHSTS